MNSTSVSVQFSFEYKSISISAAFVQRMTTLKGRVILLGCVCGGGAGAHTE